MGIDNRRATGSSNRSGGGRIQAGGAPSVPPNTRAKSRVYIAIDIESTGVEPDSGEIIEIAALRFRLEKGGRVRILEEWQTFVRPQNPIPYKITNLTGIHQSDVENAPSFNQIKDRIHQFLGPYPIIGHSVESDIGFLRRQQFEVQNPTLDTYELATLVLPQQGNYSLKAIADTLGVGTGEAHRAMADARMTMETFAALVGRIEQLPTDILSEVDRIAGQLLGDWALHRLFQDAIEVQKEEENSGGAVSNLGALLKAKLAQQQPAQQSSDLNFLFLAREEKPQELQPQPIAAEHLAQLENRVVAPILEAFAENRPLLLEVPGGTSNSLYERTWGMLVAAVETARREGKCVVLATNNEPQRERLVKQLVPELQARLAKLESSSSPASAKKRRQEEQLPFKAATVKNQSHYLCLRRWESFRKTASLTDDELKLLIKVLVWLPTTTEGDGTELRIGNSERLWSRINSQKGLCQPQFCEQAAQSNCFFYRARERGRTSHVVVADQALVLADLVGQAGTLPDYEYIVLDDAHHLEDEASKQFGTVITPYSLFNFLDWLSRPITWKADSGKERNGFLHSLNYFYGKNISAEVKANLKQVAEETAQQVFLCRDAAGNLLRELSSILLQLNQESGQSDGRVRLDHKFRHGSVWAGSVGLWHTFHHEWEELYYRLDELRAEAETVRSSLTRTDELFADLHYYVNQCNFLLNKLSAAFQTGETGQIFWMSSTRLHSTSSAAQALASEGENTPFNERSGISIFNAPLEVAPILEQYLFTLRRSVALVSSTLTTENDFSFIKDRLGLEHIHPLEVRLPPDRRYASSMLYLPSDMPEPNQSGYQKSVDHNIMELAKLLEGRMVVVFSSNSALRLTYKAIQRPLESSHILVLGQGLDGSRRSMMQRFKNTPRAIMLTTLNYWEVMDMPGADGQEEVGTSDALFNLLIITKLPFDPPTDPLFAARVESKLFDKPFEQYALPRTILRFRQTFERLLAGQPERSAVIMLDSRLVSKSYGSLFLNSLPPLTTELDSLSQMSSKVTEWLEG
jgi:Rad3-related DNA helicase/DNA polymerase III epsilon subunit-like protein